MKYFCRFIIFGFIFSLPVYALELHSEVLDLIHSDNRKVIEKSVSDLETYTNPELKISLTIRKKRTLIALNKLYDLMQNYGEELRTVNAYTELKREWRLLHLAAIRIDHNPGASLKIIHQKSKKYRRLLEQKK